MQFMSPQHVAAMNELLDASAEVRAACAALPEPRAMGYELTNGPDGETVHWTVSFNGTVQFSLDRAERADVGFKGDWAQMIRATRANRDGGAVDPGVTVAGDPAALAEIGPVLERARSVATLPVEFPEV